MTHDVAPRTIYQPKTIQGPAPRPDVPRDPTMRETEKQCAIRLRRQAWHRNKPAFNDYNRAAGLDDASNTINIIHPSAAGPPAMYPACFTDKIVCHTFSPNFKLNAVDKYDKSQEPEIW